MYIRLKVPVVFLRSFTCFYNVYTSANSVPSAFAGGRSLDRSNGADRAAKLDQRDDVVLLGVGAQVVVHLSIGEGGQLGRVRESKEQNSLLRQVRHEAAVWTGGSKNSVPSPERGTGRTHERRAGFVLVS